MFDRNLCAHQLKCFGLMDTIHIRRLGFPVRHSLEYFLNRYRVLLDRSACDPRTVSGLVDLTITAHTSSLLNHDLRDLSRAPLLPAVKPSVAL